MRTTGVGVHQRAVLGEDTRFQERLHQSQDAFVTDTTPHPVQQGGMRDLVETGFDVTFHDPLVRAGREMVHLRHRVVSPAVRTEPVGTRKKIRLENRLQHQLQRRLRHPVTNGCDPEVADLPARLGDRAPPRRQGLEGAGLQIFPQFREELLHPTHGLDVAGGSAVHPGRARALVVPDPVPGDQQEAWVRDEVEQVVEPATRVVTGPTVQLGLDLQYPAFRLK